ncbi:MAG TPA: DUF5946 family protein [Candidatus Limnocylindrales bacterium]|nr:DUF5946 family protein [Candidatus Limnocylindrales bacterium]
MRSPARPSSRRRRSGSRSCRSRWPEQQAPDAERDADDRHRSPSGGGLCGAVTIADIRAADDPVSHRELVGRWARDVWDAYVDLHLVARPWINAGAP